MALENKPLISICIPTFNRCEKVYDLVNRLLNYKGVDIEIVVLDNCSTDNTKQLLSNIVDNRFNYISNPMNIGGILNIIKVITEANGLYSFLCLDKDYIDYKEIQYLIKRIANDQDVVFGYCSLNLNEEKKDEVYAMGFESVLNMAYLSKHPSGYFYKTSFYQNSKIVEQLLNEGSTFEFNFELINAEMSFKGKSKVINLPLFYTEKKSDCAKIESFTYHKNNLYFEPQKRFKEFLVYINSAYTFELNDKEMYELIKLLYIRSLFSSTIGYKSILADQSVCLHHGITTHHVGLFELIKISIDFTRLFVREKLPISLLHKFDIWFFAHVRIIYHIFKRLNE